MTEDFRSLEEFDRTNPINLEDELKINTCCYEVTFAPGEGFGDEEREKKRKKNRF